MSTKDDLSENPNPLDLFAINQKLRERIVELEKNNTIDPLTGLHNRNYWNQELPRLNHYTHTTFAIIMVDVDKLKQANDTLGHKVGDQLLRDTAMLLDSSFRPEDTPIHLSGDEFMVIIPINSNELEDEYNKFLKDNDLLKKEFTLEQYITGIITARLNENIKKHNDEVEQKNELNKKKKETEHLISPLISLSFGVAVSKPIESRTPPHDLANTLHHADQKMYKVKTAKKPV